VDRCGAPRFARWKVLFFALGSLTFAAQANGAETPGASDAGTSDSDAGTDVQPPAASQPAQPQAPTIRITGTAVLPEDVVRSAIGSAPDTGTDLHAWGQRAAERIVDAYRSRGYRYARAWFSDSKQAGVLWFDVDEGRMRVSFVGMGSISASLFRLRLNMPGGVFQKDDVEKSIAAQKKAFKLANVYYRVHEVEGYEMTAFGDVVPARTLQIHVVRRESFGLALDIGVSAAWGVVPSLKYSAADVLWPDDRLSAQLDFAFPYRRYIFDASPRVTWVHGGVALWYRLPHFGSRSMEFHGFAPRLDSSIYLSQYARSDLNLASFYLLRDVTVANMVSTWSNVELSFGLGVDLARVFLLQAVSAQAGVPPVSTPNDVYSARALVRTAAQWTSALPWARRDQRTFANLQVELCAPLEVRSSLWGQYVQVMGRHRLFARGRIVALTGNVPFWDDVELAGDYQRVFFDDLYWARQAVQIEVAYHINLWRDWFEVGAFHDLSVFEDRISSPPTVRLMDAFGPSLHFLILDQYALSIHQGIGFAPGRFSQTLSFTVESVF
jgi:hypothetical protein